MKALLPVLFFGSFLFYQNNYGKEKLYPNEFSLNEVTLLNSPFKHARDHNIHTLPKYNVDKLLASYCKEAGLQPKDSSYTNWEGLDGHIAGHYLTAMAIYAATDNSDCKKRMLSGDE